MQHMDGTMIGGPVEPGTPTPHTSEHPPTKEQDDFEASADSAVDLDLFMPQLHKKHTGRKVAIWVVIVLLVLAVAGGGYWLEHYSSPPKPTQSSQQSTSSSKHQLVITSTTKQYTSTNFNLSFNYPQDWTIADTGNGKLTVTSPTMQLTDAKGQTQTGQVVLTIQNESSTNFSMFAKGNAVAVRTSQHITYTNPTPTQRATTYVSFLQYAATTAQGALDGVYVTGDSGYQQGQAIPEVDITKVDPVIAVSFNACSDTVCSSPKPVSINVSLWDDTSFSGPIMKMFESLALQ